jgi:hypothetical protein
MASRKQDENRRSGQLLLIMAGFSLTTPFYLLN